MFQPFTLLSLFLAAASITLATPDTTLATQVSTAARAAVLARAHAIGLTDASLELTVLPARGAPLRCAGAPEIEAQDIRHPARMRFLASCPADNWHGEYIVRASLEATVLVAANPLEANRAITETDLNRQRRTLSTPEEALSDPADAIGKASRRALRAGQAIERRALVEALLVQRGDAVQIVARNAGIVATMPGEAQAPGRRDEVIPVRNTQTGKLIRARVVASGEVEPLSASMP